MASKNMMLYSDKELSQVENVVLRCFFPEGTNMTLKQIQNRTGNSRIKQYSYERVNTALKKLEKKRFVQQKQIGKTLVYFPDFHNLNVKLAFYHYMVNKLTIFGNKHSKIYNAIKELEKYNKTDIILIFGSVSKGIETKYSDLDVMIVSNYKESENQAYALKHKYGLNIAPILLSRSEFPKIKKENPELWNDLKLNALVFQGEGLFYYWMYK